MKLVILSVLMSFIMATSEDHNNQRGNHPAKGEEQTKKENEGVTPGKVDNQNGATNPNETLPEKEEEEEERHYCNPRGDC